METDNMNDDARDSSASRGSILVSSAVCPSCGAKCVEGYDAEGVMVRVPIRGHEGWYQFPKVVPPSGEMILAVWDNGTGREVVAVYVTPKGSWRPLSDPDGSGWWTHWKPFPDLPVESVQE
jgi:hypothetical protein